VREEPGWCLLEITDTGPGLPEHVRKWIAHPTGQLHSRGRPQLGLQTAMRLAKALGGKIQLVATSPRGNALRVCLPRVDLDIWVPDALRRSLSEARRISPMQLAAGG
ncbi:MAG: ATP-binding protein, partial [Pseudomonadota bacterium]